MCRLHDCCGSRRKLCLGAQAQRRARCLGGALLSEQVRPPPPFLGCADRAVLEHYERSNYITDHLAALTRVRSPPASHSRRLTRTDGRSPRTYE